MMTEKEMHQAISAAIRKERAANDLTLNELARFIGVSTSSLSFIERGKRKISLYNYLKLTSLFDIDIHRLNDAESDGKHPKYYYRDLVISYLYKMDEETLEDAVCMLKLLVDEQIYRKQTGERKSPIVKIKEGFLILKYGHDS